MSKAMLMLLFSAVCNSAAAEWVAVGKHAALTIYANPATIFKNGNKVKMWGLRDFNAEQTDLEGFLYASIMIQKNFDCKKEQYQISNYSYHAENMGKGKVIHNSLNHGSWREITPYSITDVEKKVACGE